ncbi:uncharacterized protein [Phaseolus vulgaris]|uniref:uncharacterized protein n=1 Tax=Phaseolus vulgaris TaxID=3885 RepID=UPI0035C9568E
MAHPKSTAKPPSSSRNPPPQARRVAPGANPPPARNPPRASDAPSNQAERPASSHANLAQETPPVAGGASLPPKDYKELYPWAIPILLKETSSINTELGVLRLRKGDQSDLSFHKEHDSKVAVLPCFPDFMLGKGKLAELRAIARSHKLATGSQTVPNSVVEIAVAQGRTPPQGPTPSGALPAPQRKKLVLRKPKRKTPQVVQEEEDDEATEDGLVTKRTRVAPSSPPALPTPTPPSPPAPTQPVQATPLAVAPPVVESSDPCSANSRGWW